MTGSHDNLRRAADALRRARRVVVLTGAGVSAESGIATFRDALTGLWARYDAEALATADAFVRDPALVWGWYEWRRGQVARKQPNPGHVALAALERRVSATLVTQNVDDLHERAGSTATIHLHGRLDAPRCFGCGHRHAMPDAPPDEPEGGRRLDPPRCGRCGGLVRPGVVWFGESLPGAEWERAATAAATCDAMLVVGTSGLVHPAAGLPDLAAANGASIVEVNPRPVLDQPGAIRLVGAAGVVLPALAEAAWPSAPAADR